MAHESLQRVEEVQGSSNRVFGLVFAAVFLVIALAPWVLGHEIRLWSIGVSVAFAIASLAMPQILAPLNRIWTRFGLLLHHVVSPLVLGIMFFVVITPMGLLMRLLGKDPLRLRLDAKAPTYWLERNPPGPKPESLSDQF
jgi:Saxitoxin biosynthesis operon protein SxtJ